MYCGLIILIAKQHEVGWECQIKYTYHFILSMLDGFPLAQFWKKTGPLYMKDLFSNLSQWAIHFQGELWYVVWHLCLLYLQ